MYDVIRQSIGLQQLVGWKGFDEQRNWGVEGKVRDWRNCTTEGL